MAGFKEIREYLGKEWRALKQAPVALGIGLILFGSVIFAALDWHYSGAISVLQAAITGLQADNGGAMDRPAAALSSTEGKYVCVTVIPARKPDMRALLVEFGMRGRSSSGLAVKIVTAEKLDSVSHWEGPSLHTDLAASADAGSSLGLSEDRTDYSYRLQFTWPPVSPDASEYVYLEAEEQPVISDIFYLDNVRDLRDEGKTAKTAYDYSACPR